MSPRVFFYASLPLNPTDAQTPNHVLTATDIPRRSQRLIEISQEVTYPRESEHAFYSQNRPQNRVDATFKKVSHAGPVITIIVPLLSSAGGAGKKSSRIAPAFPDRAQWGYEVIITGLSFKNLT